MSQVSRAVRKGTVCGPGAKHHVGGFPPPALDPLTFPVDGILRAYSSGRRGYSRLLDSLRFKRTFTNPLEARKTRVPRYSVAASHIAGEQFTEKRGNLDIRASTTRSSGGYSGGGQRKSVATPTAGLK